MRWINSLDNWTSAINIQILPEEIRTGVLLCNILKFHQPSIDFSGINMTVRSKKPCINNIEKAISVMCQKGIPAKYIPTSEEIYEI